MKSYFFLAIFLSSMFELVAQDPSQIRDVYDWKTYDPNSSIPCDSISYRLLYGNWITNHFRTAGDSIHYSIGVAITERTWPLEIKGTRYRRTLAGDFYPFEINGNQLVFHSAVTLDTAYINRFTGEELIISFKVRNGYDRFFYKK